MDSIGEHHSVLGGLQQWQRMAVQHPENHYHSQQLMLHHQNSIEHQHSPINGAIERGFSYGGAQTDGKRNQFFPFRQLDRDI